MALRLRAALMLCVALAGGAPALAQPAAAPVEAHHLVPYRAIYTLTVAPSAQYAGRISGSGGMEIEFADACHGWTTRERMTLSLVDPDGTPIEHANELTAYESRDGRRFRFAITQNEDGTVTGRVRGEAALTPEGGVLRYQEPDARELAFPPGTLFPIAHIIAMLNAARPGGVRFTAPVLETGSTDGVEDTTVDVTPWLAPQPQARFPALAPLRSIRIRMTVGPRSPHLPPNGLRLYENGVPDEMKVQLDNIVIIARLTALTLLPSPC
jgi:hypothetical protein